MGSRSGISGREAQYHAAISRRVEDLRVTRRMTHAELAKVAGVPAQTLASYEAGVSRWPTFRLRLIADYLRVPLDEIVPKATSYVNSSEFTQNLF